MFGTNHYVPILKWKRAEQGALLLLTPEIKKSITPVVQLVMPKPKADESLDDLVERYLEESKKVPSKLLEAWGVSPIFIDVSLLFTSQLKAQILEMVIKSGSKLGCTMIPVIHLDDAAEIKKVAYLLGRENQRGLCLRLTCSDFTGKSGIGSAIDAFLQSSKLNMSDIDLLVDVKETDGSDGKYERYLGLSQEIPRLAKWRTFTFAAGAFPEDLTKCKLDEENLLPRIEWLSWIQGRKNPRLLRRPTFADYTIQHPIFRDDVQFFHPTSSIKYTLENEWLVMKGKKQKFELYLASAAELVKDKRYCGEKFCEGDLYILEKAKHFSTYIKNPSIKGTGSTETWLRAGINHHLTLVATQIANLPS